MSTARTAGGRARCGRDKGGGQRLGLHSAHGPSGDSALYSQCLWKLCKIKIHAFDILPSFIHLPKTLEKPEMFALPSSSQGSFQGNNTESKAAE